MATVFIWNSLHKLGPIAYIKYFINGSKRKKQLKQQFKGLV